MAALAPAPRVVAAWALRPARVARGPRRAPAVTEAWAETPGPAELAAAES
jgi:hypothetical protein